MGSCARARAFVRVCYRAGLFVYQQMGMFACLCAYVGCLCLWGRVVYLFACLCAGLFVSECMLAWGGLFPVVCVERCSTNLRSEEDEQDGDS